MKKRLWALLCVCPVLFCACGNKPPLSPPPQELVQGLAKPFESELSIDYGELSAKAVLTRGEPGACTVAFTAPEELAGMSFALSSQEISVSYGALGLTLDPTSLPGSSVVKLLVGAIDAALRDQGVDIAYRDGAVVADGRADFGSFSLRLDSATGNLLEVSVPSEDLAISFENFRFLS